MSTRLSDSSLSSSLCALSFVCSSVKRVHGQFMIISAMEIFDDSVTVASPSAFLIKYTLQILWFATLPPLLSVCDVCFV